MYYNIYIFYAVIYYAYTIHTMYMVMEVCV